MKKLKNPNPKKYRIENGYIVGNHTKDLDGTVIAKVLAEVDGGYIAYPTYSGDAIGEVRNVDFYNGELIEGANQ